MNSIKLRLYYKIVYPEEGVPYPGSTSRATRSVFRFFLSLHFFYDNIQVVVNIIRPITQMNKDL